MDLRFPGQWFQLEAGLHYNWHRHYDPSLGRYTQPDPLGFVDGPSVFGYAGGNPANIIDPDGRFGLGGAFGQGSVNALGQLLFYMKYGGGGSGLSFIQAAQCINFTSVAISAATGFVGPGLLDFVRRRASMGAWLSNLATSASFKFTANITLGGPVRLGDDCQCAVPKQLQTLVEMLQ